MFSQVATEYLQSGRLRDEQFRKADGMKHFPLDFAIKASLCISFNSWDDGRNGAARACYRDIRSAGDSKGFPCAM